jgi:hypothetical protein
MFTAIFSIFVQNIEFKKKKMNLACEVDMYMSTVMSV